ncbi:phosphoribosylaminoimidazolesuccinocarboxamide synthase, partial [Kingella kingae]
MTELSLKKIYSGKVRDLYEIDDKTMLIVATDRLSAFDVILDEPIVGKGEILTQISNFWFSKLAHIMPNHFTGQTVFDVLPENEAQAVEKRAVVAKRLTPVKIEAVIRGYLSGSGWKEYQKSGTVCGIKLPENLREAEKLPEVIFTPSTKAEVGDHDENISFE